MACELGNVHQSLFKQDTVNSFIRQIDCDRSVDSLDLVLSSVYNHEKDLFVSKFDTLLQQENAKFNKIKEKYFRDLREAERNSIHHPLIIGEITERISPHSVKLICTGQHTPKINPGYSRQSIDGNIFNY